MDQSSLQAFYKRFSGLERAFRPSLPGADAWRATTYGHGVLQTNPVGSALDQESPVRKRGWVCARAHNLSAPELRLTAKRRRFAASNCCPYRCAVAYQVLLGSRNASPPTRRGPLPNCRTRATACRCPGARRRNRPMPGRRLFLQPTRQRLLLRSWRRRCGSRSTSTTRAWDC